MSCNHFNFAAKVGVGRLTEDDKPDSPVRNFVAEIRINCADCGLAFQFLGLEPGYDNQGARVSLDGQEALIGLVPDGMKPNPLQRMAYGIGRFDG